MNFNFRLLLLPFSLIYGVIVASRNLLFDIGFFNTFEIPKKSICVGNLSVGGTGKTPHVDLITEYLQEQNLSTAILSRGYGRSTSGLLEVNKDSLAKDVGDEPLFYKVKFNNKAVVVVAEKRKVGIEYILKQHKETDVIILDDAFQHRAVKAGFNIIITDFSHLFINDFMLPAGNLREWKSGIKRSDIIIVSKCPPETSPETFDQIRSRLKLDENKIFFSEISYGALKPFSKEVDSDAKNILLVTGIGNPSPLVQHLEKKFNVTHIKYKDHHVFTKVNMMEIREKFDTFANDSKIIVTTEKDFMRLKDQSELDSENYPWFYQPIKTNIKEQYKFNLCLDEYLKI